MPDTPGVGATETSPLLAGPLKQSERPTDAPPESHDSALNTSENDVESHQQTEDAEDPKVLKGRERVKSFIPILGVGIFLAFLDQSIVAAINGEIGSDLHALRNVSWIATAYFLTMTASQPLYGKLSDVFGRKPCLIFAYTMFGIGSLGCGVTRSMEGFIAARVGKASVPTTITVLKVLGHPRHWGRWYADRGDGSALGFPVAKGTRHISRLPQSYWSHWFHFWWPDWSDTSANPLFRDPKLIIRPKEGCFHKVLVGDGKQDFLLGNLSSCA